MRENKSALRRSRGIKEPRFPTIHLGGSQLSHVGLMLPRRVRRISIRSVLSTAGTRKRRSEGGGATRGKSEPASV